MKKFILTCAFASLFLASIAQDELKERDFQVSFITPLGTNGLQSLQTANKFSINILAGAAGGLNGFEVGSLLNFENRYAHGAQISGLMNIVTGDVTGLQIAGLFNWSEETDAAQIAGFSNISSGNSQGAQISGFANVTTNHHSGGQVAGFLNTSRSLSGIQVAGFLNYTHQDVDGIQIAGFMNIARKLKGVQIAVFNFSDSVDGVAIGVFNFVRHGYHSAELGGNETFQTALTLKSGTNRFYNLYSAGVKWKKNKPLYAVGYGIGTRFNILNKLALDIDAISYWVIKKDVQGYQSINKLQPTFSYNILNKLAVFAGPTFNVVVEKNGYEYDDVSPWSVYDYTTDNNHRIQMYPGFRAGIKF